MNSPVCIDASLGLKLVLTEIDSAQVRTLWERWIQNEVQIVAPLLYLYESISAIRGQVYRGLISQEQGTVAFRALLAQRITLSAPPELYERAWNLASQLNRPKAYDCYYLALAELLDCEFWTADERLFNAVKQQLPWVKWIGNA